MPCTKVELSNSDQAAALELLRAVQSVFKSACVHLRQDQRDGVSAAINNGHPLEMRIRLLPEVFIECNLVDPAGGDRVLFSLAVPPAAEAADFHGVLQ